MLSKNSFITILYPMLFLHLFLKEIKMIRFKVLKKNYVDIKLGQIFWPCITFLSPLIGRTEQPQFCPHWRHHWTLVTWSRLVTSSLLLDITGLEVMPDSVNFPPPHKYHKSVCILQNCCEIAIPFLNTETSIISISLFLS